MADKEDPVVSNEVDKHDDSHADVALPLASQPFLDPEISVCTQS